MYDCDGRDSRTHPWRVEMNRRKGRKVETIYALSVYTGAGEWGILS
jgi:hypothetical protein